MIYVVDASVAIKWFVEEELSDHAFRLLDNTSLLEAPDLIVTEVANATWKKATRGEFSTGQAGIIVTAISHYIPSFRRLTGLVERALEIAFQLNHPIYDCVYLACAEASGGMLITSDKRLCKAAEGTDHARLVRHLEDEFLPPLRVPLSKVEYVIQLAKLSDETRQNVLDAHSDGNKIRFSPLEETRMWGVSPGRRRLRIFVDELPRHECVDLLALGWLGQGYTGTNLHTLLERAEASIDGYHDNTYVIGLTCYLRDGLALLKKQGTGGPPE